MGASLIFKRVIIFFILCLTHSFLFAQEVKKELESEVTGELGVAYGQPFSFGHNFLAEGYDIGNGFNLDAKILVSSKWLIGTQWSHYKGDVVNISKVGGIDNTSVSHLLATGNYSLLEKNKSMSIRAGLGTGYVLYRHSQSTTKFKDDGFSIVANFDIAYKLSNSFGIYLKIDHYWDFLSVYTAPELENFFRRTQTLSPFIGIRLYFF